MDIKQYFEIINDKSFFDYKKMGYKYKNFFPEFMKTVYELSSSVLPIKDFNDNNLILINNKVNIDENIIKLMSYKETGRLYGIKSAEDEIIATNRIESINFNRNSVRNILKGMAPADEVENRILGQKKGLEFIADSTNKITEENLYTLYMLTVGDFLSEENKLEEGSFYRHDAVYIIGNGVEHTGLDYRKLPEYMKDLISFINNDDNINAFIKAACIHFYISYLHPYFDGNGRVARLVHLWFLIQKGYSMTLFIPFSSLIEKSRNDYYKAFTQVEENYRFCDCIDVTPFVDYFNEKVYKLIEENTIKQDILEQFTQSLDNGDVTEKERELWMFVISRYGEEEFSTKQLEKDFGNAAYATIHKFVNKFRDMGLLKSRKMSNRVKYSVNS